MAVLYRDASGLPEPVGSELQSLLAEYTDRVIEIDWAMQAAGEIPPHTVKEVTEFQEILFAFEPDSESEANLHGATIASVQSVRRRPRRPDRGHRAGALADPLARAVRRRGHQLGAHRARRGRSSSRPPPHGGTHRGVRRHRDLRDRHLRPRLHRRGVGRHAHSSSSSGRRCSERRPDDARGRRTARRARRRPAVAGSSCVRTGASAASRGPPTASGMRTSQGSVGGSRRRFSERVRACGTGPARSF